MDEVAFAIKPAVVGRRFVSIPALASADVSLGRNAGHRSLALIRSAVYLPVKFQRCRGLLRTCGIAMNLSLMAWCICPDSQTERADHRIAAVEAPPIMA